MNTEKITRDLQLVTQLLKIYQLVITHKWAKGKKQHFQKSIPYTLTVSLLQDNREWVKIMEGIKIDAKRKWF